MSASRLGVLGGTFDPPHIGHLIVAHDAADSLELDRVLLVLSARPPHRAEPEAPPELRLAMLEAAVGGDELLEASDVELSRPGPSYTVDTLAELKERHPDAELVLLMGADQWRQLGTWRDPEGIARHATVAVMARVGEEPSDLGLGIPWQTCPVRRIDISATEIRERTAYGRSIRHLVPDSVLSVIEINSLYAVPAAQHG